MLGLLDVIPAVVRILLVFALILFTNFSKESTERENLPKTGREKLILSAPRLGFDFNAMDIKLATKPVTIIFKSFFLVLS